MTIKEGFKLYIDSDELFCRELPFHENCLFILMFIGGSVGSIVIAAVLAITTPIWGIPYWMWCCRKDKDKKL